jgi:hypothetical protein
MSGDATPSVDAHATGFGSNGARVALVTVFERLLAEARTRVAEPATDDTT